MKYRKILLYSFLIAFVVLSFMAGSYFHEINNKPTLVKTMVGNQCIEGLVSIEEWYFQQKLWAKLDMPEHLTNICN